MSVVVYAVMQQTERRRKELHVANSHLFISKMVLGDFFRNTLLSQGTVWL